MPLGRDRLNQIIDLIAPFVNTPENDRRALIKRAFDGEKVIDQITYSGQTVTFAVNCVAQLQTYNGEAAVVQLLKLLRDHYVGDNRTSEFDDIINALTFSTPAAIHDDMSTPVGVLGSHLFISYARKDIAFANRLRSDLQARGIRYWIDTEGLSPGTPNWERAIRTAIRDSSGVLWVVSMASQESEYVASEIAIAEMHKRRVYPIWADGDNWTECAPIGKHRIQYVDLRGERYASGLKLLLSAFGNVESELVMPFELAPNVSSDEAPLRNPYKGLSPFTEADVQDFFGRETLIHSLVARLETQLIEGKERFLAVLGPSGAGKSSVMRAGLIPALRQNAAAGSEGWRYLPTLTPDVHPMERFAAAFASLTPSNDPAVVLTRLFTMGVDYLNVAMEMLPVPHVVVYIDQFEELFTVTQSDSERQQFITLLTGAATEPNGKLIVLLSMRADFLGYSLNYPQLGVLFDKFNALVPPMSIPELREAIEKPARLPGVALSFDDGLVSDIVFALRGAHMALAGALPLLQFTLEKLYELREGRQLTWSAYELIGGVEGAIGAHSEAVFAELSETAQAKLGTVFLSLVSIDENTGEVSRRRAVLASIIADNDAKQLVDAFVTNGLLQRGSHADSRYIEVTHEALFRNWDRLKAWILSTQEDLILLRQVRAAAHDWQTKKEQKLGVDLDYLRWPAERLVLVYTMVERLKPALSDSERAFIEPEQYRLYRELGFDAHPLEGVQVEVTLGTKIVGIGHERRRDIGDRLAVIGDTRFGVGVKSGLPEIAWLPVTPGGVITIKKQRFTVHPFYIAKYLITYVQFQTFLDAPDGFEDDRWWIGIPKRFQKHEVKQAQTKLANAPRDSVSWYQSIAYARWIDAKYRELGLFEQLPTLTPGDYLLKGKELVPSSSGKGYKVRASDWQIRLPTEGERLWMSQQGSLGSTFPWGDWQEGCANTIEAGLSRTTAVGMYPRGAARCGALDVAGNLQEWCLNDSEQVQLVKIDNNKPKAIQGGSFHLNRSYAASSARFNRNPDYINYYIGIRLVVALLIHL